MSAPYAPLNPTTLAAGIAAAPGVAKFLGGRPADWRVGEVGDGNLNLVFVVEGPQGGLVVKQALPYVRLVGESWPLPLARSWFEYNALVAQARFAPGLVPRVHHFDRVQAMIVMEHLTPHIIMRKGLIRGIEYPRFAGDIAEFLAQTLFNTSVLAGGAPEHKARVELFAGNVELCRITEDLVFTDPYRDAPLNRWSRPFLDADKRAFESDAPLKIVAQERKYQFLTSAQALIHGDLHTGSIMLTPLDTRIIDPEFAFVGPIGFDVGAIIGNLLLAYCSQAGHESEPGARDAYRGWILDQVAAVWSGFEKRFLTLWRQSKSGEAYVAGLFASQSHEAALETARARFMRALFEDTLAFGGLKMIRRVLGLAHAEDLESIAEPARRAACERNTLRLGRELALGARGFSGIEDVVAMAHQTAAQVNSRV